MSKDLKGKRASLWHAYNALQEQGKDKDIGVAKGQLKVSIKLILLTPQSVNINTLQNHIWLRV